MRSVRYSSQYVMTRAKSRTSKLSPTARTVSSLNANVYGNDRDKEREVDIQSVEPIWCLVMALIYRHQSTFDHENMPR